MFTYFWLNYCDENHIERTPIAFKNINHLFYQTSEIIEADRLHLFLLSDGTRNGEDEYLSSLEDGTKLTDYTEEQIKKLSIFFELKRHLSLKNIFYLLDIRHLWVAVFFKNNFGVIEAVISITSLVQSVFL